MGIQQEILKKLNLDHRKIKEIVNIGKIRRKKSDKKRDLKKIKRAISKKGALTINI